MTTPPTCGYAETTNELLVPCGQPATSWRWYQDVEHEDCLLPACEDHANEGGRRMAILTAEWDQAMAALNAPTLDRYQPCGCVVCWCEDTERCHGCGAHNCNTDSCVFQSQESRKRIIYDNAPTYCQIRAENDGLRTANAELKAALAEARGLLEQAEFKPCQYVYDDDCVPCMSHQDSPPPCSNCMTRWDAAAFLAKGETDEN